VTDAKADALDDPIEQEAMFCNGILQCVEALR